MVLSTNMYTWSHPHIDLHHITGHPSTGHRAPKHLCYACMFTCVFTCMFTCMFECLFTCLFTSIFTCMFASMFTYSTLPKLWPLFKCLYIYMQNGYTQHHDNSWMKYEKKIVSYNKYLLHIDTPECIETGAYLIWWAFIVHVKIQAQRYDMD